MGLQELERICLGALELPPAERANYLDQTCTTDALRREVESLLESQSLADQFFSAPEAAEDFGEAGPYKVVEKLGEGGMGVVFRARQTEPVAREVALKIIRPGMASGQLVSRFRRERQALAIMDHPNIARVHDAGATTRGLPYLVMELVSGPTIADFCDAQGLDRKQRAALMIPICQAIQHAHLKGIIHRDIKPSNVLVAMYDGKPVPKVIDFGIAKAVEGSAPDLAGETRAGIMVGTFEYVSPEQAEPGLKDVDTRTDIYSLGALLYRIIAGKVPLQGLNLEKCTWSEILCRIRDELPPPAGAGELDWILNKALEKDRERRYQTADALALDLRRYVEGEPVEAAPPSTAYRLRKLAAKFKYAIAAAATGLVLLLVALGWMTFALRQQKRANDGAAALRDVVRKIIIERPAQWASIPNRTALRGQLIGDAEGALNVLGQDTRNDPALEAELAAAYLAIGQAKGPYSATGSEGDPAAAAPYVKKSVELYRKLAKARPGDAGLERGKLEAMAAWLHLQYRLDKFDEGIRAAQELIGEAGGMRPELRDSVEAQRYLSVAYLELGLLQFGANRSREAIESHRRAVAAFLDKVPPAWLTQPDKQDHLAHAERELAISLLIADGSGPEAENAARSAVEVVESCFEPNCRMRHAQSLGTLGEIQWTGGKKALGTSALRQAVAEFEAMSAQDPANAVFSNAAAQLRGYLALALRGSEEAVALARKNVQLASGADARLHRGRERMMVHQIVLGAALEGARHYEQARRQLHATLEQNRDWQANDDLRWSAFHELALAGEADGDVAEAFTASGQALEIAGREPPGQVKGRLLRAQAAFDYASATARWGGATAENRARARQALDDWCAGLDAQRGSLVGALMLTPPDPAEVAAIRKLLAR